MPSKKGGRQGFLSSNWTLSKCLKRPREAHEPPFFFREVRIGMLMLSILFNLSRLIYEATLHDISSILVASRLILTTLQLVDHCWFCKNWEAFFIEKKMRAYMWFRFFLTVLMYSMLYCVQTTFPSSQEVVYIADAFQWAAGLQVMLWYYWGKHWKFAWGDMNDDRRIRAIVGTMFTTALIYAILSIYLLLTSKLPLQSAVPVSSVTATLAYILMGFAFRYLDIVTNRSSQACLKILEESKVDVSRADSHHHRSILGNPDGLVHQSSSSTALSTLPVLHSTPTPSRRSSNLMNNIRQVSIT